MAQTEFDPQFEGPEDMDFTGDLEADRPSSLMQGLRNKRRELDEQKFFDLEVPAYGGCMKIRYGKNMTVPEIDKILKKVSKSKNPLDSLNAACDIIAKCTHEIYGRGDEEDPWTLLEDQENGVILWGRALLKYLDLPHSDTTRGAVKTVFGSDLVIMATQGRLFTWIQGELDENSGTVVTGE